MDKIEKIRLIEMPRAEITLGTQEMSKIVGGAVCTSYDKCWIFGDHCSGTYSDQEACDGTTGLKCGSYSGSLFD